MFKTVYFKLFIITVLLIILEFLLFTVPINSTYTGIIQNPQLGFILLVGIIHFSIGAMMCFLFRALSYGIKNERKNFLLMPLSFFFLCIMEAKAFLSSDCNPTFFTYIISMIAAISLIGLLIYKLIRNRHSGKFKITYYPISARLSFIYFASFNFIFYIAVIIKVGNFEFANIKIYPILYILNGLGYLSAEFILKWMKIDEKVDKTTTVDKL